MRSVNQHDQRVVKIGCASGGWGDTNTAAVQLVHLSDIDYIVYDYLSGEVLVFATADAERRPVRLDLDMSLDPSGRHC